MGIFTLFQIMTILSGTSLKNLVKAYANARKSLHYAHNFLIWSLEMSPVLIFHELVILHYVIPTAVFTWEMIVVKVADE